MGDGFAEWWLHRLLKKEQSSGGGARRRSTAEICVTVAGLKYLAMAARCWIGGRAAWIRVCSVRAASGS